MAVLLQHRLWNACEPQCKCWRCLDPLSCVGGSAHFVHWVQFRWHIEISWPLSRTLHRELGAGPRSELRNGAHALGIPPISLA